jgi:hypothetical protein
MAIEKLPTTADGTEETVTETDTPDFGRQTVREFTGPTAELQTLRDAYKAQTGIDGTVGSLELRTSRGRGSLRVNFQRVWEQIDPLDQSVQELNAFDVVRPIYTSAYFRTETAPLIASVRDAAEQQLTPAEVEEVAAIYDAAAGGGQTWGTRASAGKAWQLLGHLQLGMESYNETAYEFVQTWRSTSTAQLKIASSNPNTVQTLPALSGVMARLIDSLPTGEWLKKPTTVTSVGNGIFAVRVSYLWAVKWSVVYGGTETGLS